MGFALPEAYLFCFAEFENEIPYERDSGPRIQKCGNGKIEQ